MSPSLGSQARTAEEQSKRDGTPSYEHEATLAAAPWTGLRCCYARQDYLYPFVVAIYV